MKTISLKKVSAVAVASLGFGLLSVVPASAAGVAASSAVFNTALTTVTSTSNVLTGATATIPLTVNFTPGVDAETGIVTCVTTSRPANSQGVTTTAGNPTTFTGYAAGTNSVAPTGGANVATVVGTTAAAGAVVNTFTANYVPNVPGIYVVTCTLTGTGVGTVKPTGSLTHVWTINAGFGAVGGTTNVNKAFPLAGSNITTGWTATAGGQAALRITGFPADATTQYFINIDKGSLVSITGSDARVGFTTAGAGNFVNGTNLSGGGKWTLNTPNPSDSVDVVVTDTGSVASTTVTVTTVAALTGASTTYVAGTVTYGVAAAPSAQFSLLTLNAGAGVVATGAAADTTATTVARTANTKQFTIIAKVKDQYNVDFSGFVLGASISGPGSLGIGTTVNSTATNAGRSLTATLADNDGEIIVFGDGTAGTSVITITATTASGATTVLGTKTVKFAGSPSKITVTQNLYVAKAGTQLGATPSATVGTNGATTVATTPAFYAEVMDSNGVDVVAGSTYKLTSSDSTVIVAGTCVETITGGVGAPVTNASAPGNFECSVSGATGAASGKSATVTFSILNTTTGLYDIVATPITFTIGGAISKSVIAADKATYTAGEAMTLTATSTDSSGNKAFDGQTPFASISGNKSFGGTNGGLSLTSKEIVNGKYSTTSSKGVASVFAPSTPGSFTISGLATDLALGTAYSVTGSVTDGNAAIMTQIDALNAKIVALNALIAKIMKRLGVK